MSESVSGHPMSRNLRDPMWGGLVACGSAPCDETKAVRGRIDQSARRLPARLPSCPAEQHSRNQKSGARSKESGARSQNGARVAVQQAADLFQRGEQFIRLAISKVMRKNQVVSTFLHRTLGDIHVAG